MLDLILHHYDFSPYGRKVRAALGLKSMTWRSAEVPSIPPRPVLALLAGGYRRIPVLQIGADLFCDTNLILPVLDAVQPTPPLRPLHDTLSVPVSQWFEPRMFTVFSALRFRTREDTQGVFASSEERAAFARDRAGFMAPMLDISKNAESMPTAAVHARSLATWIEDVLGLAGEYLQGAAVSHADLSAWHPFHWLKGRSAQRELLDGFPRLWAWVDRIEAIGEGQRSPILAAEALAMAHEARPTYRFAPSAPSPLDPELGVQVTVGPADYGMELVTGKLVSIGADHVSILRATDETGDIVVHFPRWGYRVARCAE